MASPLLGMAGLVDRLVARRNPTRLGVALLVLQILSGFGGIATLGF